MQERKKPGPKPQHGLRKELHLKFSPELAEHIERAAKQQGYQAFFDGLVRADMEQNQFPVQHENSLKNA